MVVGCDRATGSRDLIRHAEYLLLPRAVRSSRPGNHEAGANHKTLGCRDSRRLGLRLVPLVPRNSMDWHGVVPVLGCRLRGRPHEKVIHYYDHHHTDYVNNIGLLRVWEVSISRILVGTRKSDNEYPLRLFTKKKPAAVGDRVRQQENEYPLRLFTKKKGLQIISEPIDWLLLCMCRPESRETFFSLIGVLTGPTRGTR